MNKTKAPETTPSPSGIGGPDPRNQFLAAAANMSWQLALVVLVPILGGFELDKRLDTLPLLTIIGFGLAMAGMSAVVWRQMKLFNPPLAKPSKGHRS